MSSLNDPLNNIWYNKKVSIFDIIRNIQNLKIWFRLQKSKTYNSAHVNIIHILNVFLNDIEVWYISLLSTYIKLARISDLTSFNSLLMLPMYVFDLDMILLALCELISMITVKFTNGRLSFSLFYSYFHFVSLLFYF